MSCARAVRRSVLAVALLTFAFGSDFLAAQGAAAPVRRISGAPTCEHCRVVLTDLPRTAPIPLDEVGSPVGALMDREGRTIVWDGKSLPAVFAPDGSLLTRIGSRGGGPGEVRDVGGVYLLRGDSLLLHDASQGRAVVFDSRFIPARTITGVLPASFVEASDWPRRVLMSATLYSPEGAGFPLHLVDLSGPAARTLRSMSAGDGTVVPGGPRRLPDIIAPAVGGGFWTAEPRTYELVRWSPAATIVERVRREADWFDGPSRTILGGPNVPPTTTVRGIHEDDSGLLWAYSWVPSPNWRRAWTRIDPRSQGELRASAIAVEELYHTRVEVVDLRTFRLVATTVLPYWVVAVGREGHVGVMETLGDGQRLRWMGARVEGAR